MMHRRGKRYLVAILVSFLTAAPFLAAGTAAGVDPGETIIGLSMSGLQKAYPLSLFKGESVVNDLLNGLPLIVYYDPRSNQAAAFFSLVSGEPLEFSGEAAAQIADDLTTATKWDMKSGRALSGGLFGMSLVPIPVRLVSLGEWQGIYPRTAVLQPAGPGAEGSAPVAAP